MASRLYLTTRPLFAQVVAILTGLGLASVGTPTTFLLVALYVTGLILLDVRQTQTRVTRSLPGRCHDALNRLLRLTPFSTRALMRLLVQAVIRWRSPGYLLLDDVVVEKAFAKKLPWAGWTYSFAKKRKVNGLRLIVLIWCRFGGRWRFPCYGCTWRKARARSRSGGSWKSCAKDSPRRRPSARVPFTSGPPRKSCQ